MLTALPEFGRLMLTSSSNTDENSAPRCHLEWHQADITVIFMPICTLAICLLRKMQQANGLDGRSKSCVYRLANIGRNKLWKSYFRLERDHGGASPRKTQGSNWIGFRGI